MKILISLVILFCLKSICFAQGFVVVDWSFSGAADGFTVYWEWNQNVHNMSTADGNARNIAIPQEHFIPDQQYIFRMEAFTYKDGATDLSNQYQYLHDLGCPDPYAPPLDNLGASYPQVCN